jgi:type I restriction enzyme S subunit
MQFQYQLPPDWIWITLNEVTLINPRNNELNYLSSELPVTFVPMAAVEADNGIISKPEILPLAKAKKGHTQFKENDVLFARITPCMENGKIAIARNLKNGLGFGSTEFHIFRSNGAIQPEYLFYCLRSKSFRDLAAQNMTGTVGQMRVPAEFLKNVLIPLPPLNEQNRIIIKLEELLSELRTSNFALQRVPSIIKQLRQSMLKSAFRGDLIEHDLNDEPANILLIKSKYWNGSSITSKIDIENNGKERFYVTKLVELPESWVWCRLKDICTTTSGGTPLRSKKEYYGGKIPWLKSGELEENIIQKTEETITELGLKNSSAKIFPKGTVVIALYGATIGRTGILEIDAATNQAVCAIFNDESIIYRDYLFFFLQSIRENLIKQSFGGAQPNISQAVVRDILIPLAPMNEQKRIVYKISEMLSKTHYIENATQNALNNSNLLEQSILNKAFHGELVIQNPNDESASILIKRIKLESEKITDNLGGHKRKMRNSRVASKKILYNSIQDILKQIGKASVEEVLKIYGKNIEDFWNQLKIEIDLGKIEEIRIGNTISLKVKN